MRRVTKSRTKSLLKTTTDSAIIMPFFVPPKDIISTPRSLVKERTSQPSATAALAMRAPSMCTNKPFACATSTMALISSGVYTVATSVDCVSATRPGWLWCGLPISVRYAERAPAEILPCTEGMGVILQPTTASTAPLSEVCVWAMSLHRMECHERIMRLNPSTFAPVPSGTRNTSTSSPNSALKQPSASAVHGSSP